MARGSIAKEAVIKKISEAFGDDFVGEFDKKIYVWAKENGERLQIYLTLTCPKTPISVDKSVPPIGNWDFSDDAAQSAQVVVTDAPPAEITPEEEQNIVKLMKMANLDF